MRRSATRTLRAFLSDESGATAIEYGLIVALMAVGCIAAFTVFGGNLKDLFGSTQSGAGGKIIEATGQI